MFDQHSLLLERVPEYAALTEQIDALRGVKAPAAVVNMGVTPVQLLRDEIIAQVAAGRKPTTQTMVDGARKAITEVAAVNTATVALKEAKASLQARLKLIGDRHQNLTFTALDEELAEVVETGKAILNRAELATAETAITKGRADDWTRWRDLQQRYARLRRVQIAEQRKRFGDLGGLHPLGLFVQDPAAAWDGYFEWKFYGRLLPPWPYTNTRSPREIDEKGPNTRETLLDDASKAEFLTWALDNEVELWVPSPGEFAAVCRRLDEAQLGSAPVDVLAGAGPKIR